MPKNPKDIYVRFNENSRGTAEQTMDAVRRLGGNPIVLSSDDPNAFQNLDLHGSSVINFVELKSFDSDAEMRTFNQLSTVDDLIFIPVPSGSAVPDGVFVNFDMASRIPLDMTTNPHISITSIAKKAFHQKEYLNEGRPIFISYARESVDFANTLKVFLEGEQFDVWMDKSRMIVGQEWKKEIDDALGDSLMVVVVMCQNSANSLYVTYEWSYALGLHTPIYPIRLLRDDGAIYHSRLLDKHYADWTNRLDEDTEVWDDLVSEIEELIEEG